MLSWKKVTNITKCKVVKVKGQHGGVVIAGDYFDSKFSLPLRRRTGKIKRISQLLEKNVL